MSKNSHPFFKAPFYSIFSFDSGLGPFWTYCFDSVHRKEDVRFSTVVSRNSVPPWGFLDTRDLAKPSSPFTPEYDHYQSPTGDAVRLYLKVVRVGAGGPVSSSRPGQKRGRKFTPGADGVLFVVFTLTTKTPEKPRDSIPPSELSPPVW